MFHKIKTVLFIRVAKLLKFSENFVPFLQVVNLSDILKIYTNFKANKYILNRR